MTIDQVLILWMDADALGCGKTQLTPAEAAAKATNFDATAKSAVEQVAEMKAKEAKAEKRRQRRERRKRKSING